MTDADSLRVDDIFAVALGGTLINKDQAIFMAGQGVRDIVHLIDTDSAGLKGALSSITNAEMVGITVAIATLPPGSDDADMLRQKGNQQVYRDALNTSMNAGEYLARDLAAKLSKTSVEPSKLISLYQGYATSLTPASRMHWRKACTEVGLDLDEHINALSHMVALLAAHTPMSDACNMVKERYGLSITINEAVE